MILDQPIKMMMKRKKRKKSARKNLKNLSEKKKMEVILSGKKLKEE